MPLNELETFLVSWDREAASTVKLLQALPSTQYEFRPDAGGRSLGELAWHLAVSDAHMSYGRWRPFAQRSHVIAIARNAGE
jgi:uncharacterized damage-inducible protein DinB